MNGNKPLLPSCFPHESIFNELSIALEKYTISQPSEVARISSVLVVKEITGFLDVATALLLLPQLG